MEDPETKAQKPFGFCEYEEAEGVIRALNLLNNLAVGGQVGWGRYVQYSCNRKCNLGLQ